MYLLSVVMSYPFYVHTYVLQRTQHPTAIMNNGVIPVPDEALKYRFLLVI